MQHDDIYFLQGIINDTLNIPKEIAVYSKSEGGGGGGESIRRTEHAKCMYNHEK